MLDEATAAIDAETGMINILYCLLMILISLY